MQVSISDEALGSLKALLEDKNTVEAVLVLNSGACFGAYFDFVPRCEYPNLPVANFSVNRAGVEILVERELYDQQIELEIVFTETDGIVFRANSGMPQCRCGKSIFSDFAGTYSGVLIGGYCQE